MVMVYNPAQLGTATQNQRPDTSKLPRFGAPCDYLTEDGEVRNQEDEPDRIVPSRESYAAFGAPNQYMSADGQVLPMPSPEELAPGQHVPVDISTLPKFGAPADYLPDEKEKS